ncbi:discoidin domain-containing protein [Streptacidiphilus sp. P02-A3a]|uniref:discoidin domain-containing protein n=1 Tax=Streptacidiphilus sp. P02-A3a TaxID=2704468 RepID=UPI0015F9CB7F|nr:discoidin domain-containing protein [Streptacidiphilus sp. P02-A3a]QMU70933.1 choice-of-anchor D domain-containing protein [Streptacidiphilus sp. P02-A3a]
MSPSLRRTLAALASAALAATGLALASPPASATSAPAAAPAAVSADSAVSPVPGVGASLPFTEYLAADARSNGTRIGPDRTFTTVAAEAVGRTAVTLDHQGQYVEFTLSRAANSVDVRYSIPDSADGQGQDGSLGVYVGGSRIAGLATTSRYDDFYGSYPFTNNPADGTEHHYFDDSRVLLGRTLPAGTRVRVELGAPDPVVPTTVNLADFEQVAPPKAEPAGFISVTDPAYGADPTGKADATAAIQSAIDAAEASGKGVWLPPGTYAVTGHLIVDKVTMDGAGPWYSVLTGLGVGVYGNYAPDPSSAVHLADFAIFGQTTDRDDSAQVNGVGGAMGGGSTINDLWIQHTKVGMWFDGPFDGLTITDSRIQDTTADGINLHDGISHVTVSDTLVRNTGDDGLAMWSDQNADHDNTFTRDTVEVPVLANDIAVYGGHDNTVSDDLVTDTVTQGGGIHVANRFGSVPLSGTTTVTGDVALRTGVLDPNWQFGVGALWFWASDESMTGKIDVSDTLLLDNSYEGVQFISNPGMSISGVALDRVGILGSGTFAVQLQSPGSATFTDVTAAGLGAAGVYDCSSGFSITGTGNHGWSSSACGFPAPGPLTLTPSALAFTPTLAGTASAARTVTVSNPSTRPQHLASVTATGTFGESDDCPAWLAPGASCTATVRFTPSQAGDVTGLLTVSDGTPAGRYLVRLSGHGIASDGNLAEAQPMTASSALAGFPAANAADDNTDTYWESDDGAAFPQTLTVDLGSAQALGKVVLKLPTNPAWGQRTQNIQVLGSTDGTAFTGVVPAQDYVFDAVNSADTVTIALPAGTDYRYLRLSVADNSAWPAAQISEFQVYAP